VAGQLDALRDAALGGATMTNPQTGDVQQSGGLDSVFNACMYDMAKKVRQYIASNPRNRLSQTDASVPPELKDMLIWLTLGQMIGRLSIALPLNPDQKARLDDAMKDLDKLRNIEPPWLAISNPVDPEPNPELTVGVYGTVIHKDCRQATQRSLRAL
jgi:hypothetical protein